MPRIEVDPQALQTTSGQQVALSGRLVELCGQLDSVAASGAEAAGTPGAGAAMADTGLGWVQALLALSDQVGGLGANLSAAAGAYATTDQQAMPQGAR
jgi:uncharacterized protein YukE